MNGAFYSFLISQCAISFPHAPGAFDWIPFQVRKQLVMLLDAWKAAVMRLEYCRNPGKKDSDFWTDKSAASPVSPYDIELASAEKKERWHLFDSALKKAYQDAEKLSGINGQHGILTAPVPDLAFWNQVYEREIYEARLAAGEPVVLYEGRCCLYGSLHDYEIGRGYVIVPGPYPGLQYYVFEHELPLYGEQYFWNVALKERANDQRMQYAPIPMDCTTEFESPKEARKRLARDYGIIGPATYAEAVHQATYPLRHSLRLWCAYP